MLCLLVVLPGCDSTEQARTREQETLPAYTPYTPPPPAASPEDSAPLVPAPFDEGDPEYKLASIDAGQPLRLTDSRIRTYAKVLDKLESKCHEDRTKIGDMTVIARDLLEERGTSLTLLRVLQSVDRSIPRKAPETPCADVFTALVVLIGG